MSDWIEWNGGECPVEPDVMVCVKFRDGHSTFEDVRYCSRSATWEWAHDGSRYDIIAYRVIGAGDD